MTNQPSERASDALVYCSYTCILYGSAPRHPTCPPARAYVPACLTSVRLPFWPHRTAPPPSHTHICSSRLPKVAQEDKDRDKDEEPRSERNRPAWRLRRHLMAWHGMVWYGMRLCLRLRLLYHGPIPRADTLRLWVLESENIFGFLAPGLDVKFRNGSHDPISQLVCAPRTHGVKDTGHDDTHNPRISWQALVPTLAYVMQS